MSRRTNEMFEAALVYIFIFIVMATFVVFIFWVAGKAMPEETHDEYKLYRTECERYGKIHYDNEICTECVIIKDLYVHENSRRYINEKNDDNIGFVNDTINVRDCRTIHNNS